MNLTLPNLLSLLRMGLIPLFVIAVLEGRPGRALVVFVIAGLTDMLDGFIARFFDQMSVLGAYLDPIADKLLLTTAYVMLTVPTAHAAVVIPVWVTVLVIARDVLIMTLALIFYLVGGITRFPPTVVSKINTAVQIVGILLVLLTGIYAYIESAAILCLYLVAALTVISGVHYIFRVNRMSGELSDEKA